MAVTRHPVTSPSPAVTPCHLTAMERDDGMMVVTGLSARSLTSDVAIGGLAAPLARDGRSSVSSSRAPRRARQDARHAAPVVRPVGPVVGPRALLRNHSPS